MNEEEAKKKYNPLASLGEESIFCLITVDDRLPLAVYGQDIEAYCRGFILKNRATGKIRGVVRYKHPDGTRSKMHLDRPDLAPREFAEKVAEILRIAANLVLPGAQVECHYPPVEDMEGQLDWLQKMDLVTVTRGVES